MSAESSTEAIAPDRPKIVAVVVSYNRRDLLEKTLAGIAGGVLVPDAVVLVENASTDATRSWLAELDYALPLDVVLLNTNLGGAGGFTVGIDRALSVHRADLVWVMDDDTEPWATTLSASVAAWEKYDDAPDRRPAFLASSVLWTDGREHPMNSMIQRIGASVEQKVAAYRVGGRSIRSGSFVSLLMDGAAMRRAGLPYCDYFIWNDDFEYSTRLARFRDAILVKDSVVTHHTKKFGTTDVDPGPRFYNDVRNKLWVFTRSHSLAPWEKVLYSGATARLWIRTLRHSPARRPLLGHLVRGVRDALRAPRPNAEVLAGVYDLRTHRTAEETSGEAVEKASGARPRAEEPEEGFTVLMSVFARDEPDWLREAVASSTWLQTLPPSQLVLVVDGPVPAALARAVEELAAQAEEHGISADVLRRRKNEGLAQALNLGLRLSRYPVVARADADDVSEPHRFAAQVPPVASGTYDVLGSAMTETDAEGRAEAVRRVETDPAAIRRAARHRNPLCHPTVVFSAEAVRAVGGYERIPVAEDYGLWARMLDAGMTLGNLAEPLVRYRAGAGAWQRRGGLGALAREVSLQNHLRAQGFLGGADWARNVLVRGGYRLVPSAVRISAYRALVGARGAAPETAPTNPTPSEDEASNS